MKKPYIVKDRYFLEAKKLWYRARSAFKLLEIQEKFWIIKPWFRILDIWAAPWSFIQVVRNIIKEKGMIVWVDIQKIEKFSFPNVVLLQEDVFKIDSLMRSMSDLWISNFDLIISDIAPNTTGQTWVDQYRSIELNLEILKISETVLKKWWNLLLKVFVGEDINDLAHPLKSSFEKISRYKPKASRDRSFEEYFICFKKK
jgi:23S rRNA (uridine2552-2'-O)-methyltransferase